MTFTLHQGDCIEVMRAMPDNSVDSVVTDPPYHLTNNGGGPGGKGKDNAYSRSRAGATTGGFMGMAWDGGDVAQNPEVWVEALRILKPGGYLLAFSGSRTYHRMACAIDDAGFEIRDQIMWIYGSGFPKSLNLEGDRQGWGTALKPAHEPICMARKPLAGTVAANVLAHGTGALNIDGCRVPGAKPATTRGAGERDGWGMQAQGRIEDDGAGRWPANVIHDGSAEVVAAFPAATGQKADISDDAPSAKLSTVYEGGPMPRNGESSQDSENTGTAGFKMKPGARRLDDGSAARFFYCAKASAADRHEGLPHPGHQFHKGSTLRDAENLGADRKGNHHPTVKPTDLMAYLCRLVTPPGGTVLDPFMGSGSTGKAAVLEGFNFIGIDLSPEYVAIARARIDHAQRQGHQPSLLEAA